MKSKLIMKITIIILGFAMMADMVVIPAVGGIFATFPTADPFFFTLLLTGPLLFVCIGSLLAGYLAHFMSKKALLIGAYCLFIIASCGGALFDNIYYLVVMRLLVGFAYGVVPTATNGLIAELFSEEKERSSVYGLNSGMTAVWGMILSLASGFIAVSNWHLSFYLYLIAIPILILTIAFIPKTPPEGATSSELSSKEKIPHAKFLPVAISFFIYNTFYNILLFYVAIYVQEQQLGDASTAGIMSTAATGGMFIACILFSKIYMRLKRATSIICFVFIAIAFIILALPINVWLAGLMIFLAGAGYGLCLSYNYMYTSMIVPLGVVSFAMGVLSACLSLGGFLSSYALQLYQYVLGATTMAPTFLYIGLTLAIGAVLSIIMTIRARKTPVVDVNEANANN